MIKSNAENSSTPTRLSLMVFKGVQNLPLLAAQEKGFLTRRGLVLDIEIAPNSMVLRDGLASGRFQIVHTAVDNALAMVDQAHVDVAVILGGDNSFNALYVQPDIKGYEDLRGQHVIVDALDTAYGLMLYAMLNRKGIGRDDYSVTSVGATHLRIAAMLQDPSIKASIMNPPYSIMAERAGLKRLDLAADVLGPYLGTSAFVLRQWAASNRDIVVRYLRAYIEGARWALDPANRDEAIAMTMKAVDVPHDIAAASYAIAVDPQHGMARDAALDGAALANVIGLRAAFDGRTEVPPIERYFDSSFYDQAIASLPPR